MNLDDVKPILCLDFDGVIHDYKKGWQEGIIYGEVTEGFWPWAIEAAKYFKLYVYSSRSKGTVGRDEMEAWMKRKWDKFYFENTDDRYRGFSMPVFSYTAEKPAAFLTIDDRALTFCGRWSVFSPPQDLRSFTPWNVGANLEKVERDLVRRDGFPLREELKREQSVKGEPGPSNGESNESTLAASSSDPGVLPSRSTVW